MSRPEHGEMRIAPAERELIDDLEAWPAVGIASSWSPSARTAASPSAARSGSRALRPG
jgi:hypothetical protein